VNPFWVIGYQHFAGQVRRCGCHLWLLIRLVVPTLVWSFLFELICLVRRAESSFPTYIPLKITKKHKSSHHGKAKDQTTSRRRRKVTTWKITKSTWSTLGKVNRPSGVPLDNELLIHQSLEINNLTVKVEHWNPTNEQDDLAYPIINVAVKVIIHSKRNNFLIHRTGSCWTHVYGPKLRGAFV
jgi:hypothetical protein